ncbi:MAG: MFS transporter [Microcella sp.]|uniref:MFS transporter n=1 Tax=Microcella sp. TaxID=1913979 RepID=UPI0024CBDA43|nr:MFS transporter [Microcella sp.]UYN83556.1 MAG: MFS transporter [Microcella sp.]
MRITPFAYLSSYLLSLLGNSIAAVALPLIVLQTTGSALGAGIVAASTALPAVVAGLLMGVVIDRINRRTSSVVTDLISAAAIAALPLVDLISGLSLGWFVLFGIIGSLGDVPGMTARETLLPAVVRHSGVSAERLIGLREALGAVALLIGPAIAGVLITALDGSTVLWITAGTSFAAALITLLIPHSVGRLGDDEPSGSAGSSWQQLRTGWRALASSRFLVAVTSITLIAVTVLAAMQSLVLPVYFTVIEQPGLLGFVLTALAAGMLVGAGTYAAVGHRGSRRVWFVVALGGTTAGFALIAWLPSPAAVFAGAMVVGAASGVLNSVLGVLLIERIPELLRGRVLSSQNAIMTLAAPAGIMAAALLIEYASLALASALIASLWLIALVVGLGSRSLRTLERSTPGEDAPDAQQ